MGARLIKGCFDVHVVVSDLEQSLRFWSGTMGFETEEVVDLPGGNKQFRLRNGNALVKLMTRGEHPLAPLYDADGYRGLTFGASNFEETVEACRKGGYRILLDARPSFAHPDSGKQICVLEDPEGNIVELESAADEV